MNRAQLIRKLEGDRYTRKIFDELVKAAGDRTKLVSALLTVVEAWGQKVPLFPGKKLRPGFLVFVNAWKVSLRKLRKSANTLSSPSLALRLLGIGGRSGWPLVAAFQTQWW